MVHRMVGSQRLPDVSSLSRGLARYDERSVANVQDILRQRVLARRVTSKVSTLTLDFDGSGIGFTRKKKGQRTGPHPATRAVPLRGRCARGRA